VDFRKLLASIADIEGKHLFIELETYPGTPLESIRRDFACLSRLEF
jgi:hypothetical protein